MNVPVATSGERSRSVSCSIAAGGGNTKGKKKNPSATPRPVPNTPPSRKSTRPRQNRRITSSSIGAPKESSVGGRQATHGELDTAVGKLAPGFDFRHVGGLGKAAEQLARLVARGLARQRERVAAKSCRAVAASEPLCGAAGDVGRSARSVHGFNLRAIRGRGESRRCDRRPHERIRTC